MPRGSSRQFRELYDGAANRLGVGGSANRVDSVFLARARGALKQEGFAVDGRNVSSVFQSNADLAASELGLAPGQTQSLDYGVGEGTQSLETTTHDILGIADVWSFGFWIKPVIPIPGLTRIWRLSPVSSNNDFVTLAFDNLGGGNRFMSDLIDEDNSATGTNNRTWDGLMNGLNGVWTHILLTFTGSINGVDPEIDLYRNGVFVSNTSGSAGGSGAPRLNQSDRARRIESLGNDGASRSIGGILMQAQLWRADVGAEAAFLANAANAATRDLNTNGGGYTFAGDLAHWWKPGDSASPNLGKDFATGFAEVIDLVTVVNLDDNDRVADVPA